MDRVEGLSGRVDAPDHRDGQAASPTANDGGDATPSPYDAPELYDLVLEHLDFDLSFWRDEARRARGPVLEVGCGTGRVLLRLLAEGIDIEGLDLYPAMLERLKQKAAARGLDCRVYAGDMRDFTTPRRYRLVICPFNGFAHNETIDDQLKTLRCCRERLASGGAFALHMSYPSAAYWMEKDGEPVLEIEVANPETGRRLRMYDTRHRDRVAQLQRSDIEIQELEGDRVVASHRFRTSQRWMYRFELELLFRVAGFARWEFYGGFDRTPLKTDTDPMLAVAWRE